jgi:hypothetical protein
LQQLLLEGSGQSMAMRLLLATRSGQNEPKATGTL